MRHKMTASARRASEVADMIRQWPQGRDLPDQEIKAVAELVRDVTLPANWAFIAQDTPADATYLLLSGEAKVVYEETVVAKLGPGSVIGEMALANHTLRTATVVTTQPSRLLHVSAEAFELMQKRCPQATTRWLAYASGRARELAAKAQVPTPAPMFSPAAG
jgi:CRP-like cAMP-binding protein